MIAVVLLDNGTDTWRYQVAKNYTQLNYDYCMADRFEEDRGHEFIITDDISKVNLSKYEFTIQLKPGVIFDYNRWTGNFKNEVLGANVGVVKLHNNVTVYNSGGGPGEIEMPMHFPCVDPSTDDSFSATHTNIMNSVVSNSNISYVIHNEIPKPKKAHEHLNFAMTVSSGFYINYVLNLSSFDTDTSVHHMDVSPMSLKVRKYIIENWDGEDFYAWMDHVYEKFELLEVYNGKKKLRSYSPATKHVWQHVLDTFDGTWVDHWRRYQQCKHTYNVCNFSDNAMLRNTLDKLDLKGNGAFWWNGALKRLPANVLKSSQQSYTGALDFFNTIAEYNPNIAGYGSDHCVTPVNGETMQSIADNLVANSREALWKKF
jgi:hypothetical protein